MAEVRGRKCDRQGCTTFISDTPNLPVGWIQVRPIVDPSVKQNGVDAFEYCSDYCVACVFLDRYDASNTKRFNRPKKFTEEGREALREQGRRVGALSPKRGTANAG